MDKNNHTPDNFAGDQNAGQEVKIPEIVQSIDIKGITRQELIVVWIGKGEFIFLMSMACLFYLEELSFERLKIYTEN